MNHSSENFPVTTSVFTNVTGVATALGSLSVPPSPLRPSASRRPSIAAEPTVPLVLEVLRLQKSQGLVAHGPLLHPRLKRWSAQVVGVGRVDLQEEHKEGADETPEGDVEASGRGGGVRRTRPRRRARSRRSRRGEERRVGSIERERVAAEGVEHESAPVAAASLAFELVPGAVALTRGAPQAPGRRRPLHRHRSADACHGPRVASRAQSWTVHGPRQGPRPRRQLFVG